MECVVHETGYRIGEVSDLTGMTGHTLRFYEKEGLFLHPVRRDSAGRRRFSQQDVDWLRTGARLRATGMPLSDIRRWVELVRDGDDTAQARSEILREHEARVRVQLAELQAVLATLEEKIASHAPAPRSRA